MKKNSDVIASRIGKMVLGVGLLAALLSPIGGAVLGGWSTASAAAAAMGLGAAVPLAGAGAFGGFVLGSFAAPIVAIGSLFAAGGAALLAKGVASIFDRPAAAAPENNNTQRAYAFLQAPSRMAGLKIGRSFDAAVKLQKPRNDNAPKPQPKHIFAPKF